MMPLFPYSVHYRQNTKSSSHSTGEDYPKHKYQAGESLRMFFKAASDSEVVISIHGVVLLCVIYATCCICLCKVSMVL